jgi:hypothetical protein
MTRLRTFLDMVRFEHTIFALPFAYLGMVLAANWPSSSDVGGRFPTLRQLVWITVAMVAARMLAFAVNRYADRGYDARNSRTADRPIPTGRLSSGATLGYGAVALVVLALAAWQLNELALKLLCGPDRLAAVAGRHLLDRWLRLDLRLPGHRVRPRRGVAFGAGTFRQCRRPAPGAGEPGLFQRQ